jgi:hypothetical protein
VFSLCLHRNFVKTLLLSIRLLFPHILLFHQFVFPRWQTQAFLFPITTITGKIKSFIPAGEIGLKRGIQR